MSYDRDIRDLSRVIQTAERCPMYEPSELETCDGLDGCEDCLEIVAKEILRAVERLSR